MAARVIFDTGSEHLAVTSALCNNHTAGKYHFSQDSKFSKTLKLEVEEESSKSEEKVVETANKTENTTNEYDDTDVMIDDIYDSAGKSIIPKLDKKKKEHPVKQDRCHSQAYNMH